MKKNYNKFIFSIILVFLGAIGMGQTTLDPNKKSIQAWIYPGYNDPATHACDATSEYQDGRLINLLKPEYLHINSGVLQLYPFSLVGCNGYNENNASDVLNLQFGTVTRPGYITVSGSHLSLKTLLEDQTKKNALKNAIINYMTYNNSMPNMSKFEGVELDFENPSISDTVPFGPSLWNDPVPINVSCWGSYQKYWSSYFQLINMIGDALHSMPIPKKLMIDCPEMNQDASGKWDYGFFKNNPNVDYICVMAYDYMYTHSGEAVAPTNWVSNIVDYVISKMGGSTSNDYNMNKVIIGIPSYGYTLVNNEVVLKQKLDAQAQTGYYNISDNPRDAASYERYFTKNGIKWYYQDGIGMSAKEEFIRSKGIKHVSVWSLGGNTWFNKMEDTLFKTPIASSDNIITSTSWNNPTYALGYVNTGDNNSAYCQSINNELVIAGFSIHSANIINGIEVAIIAHTTDSADIPATLKIQLSNDAGNTWTLGDTIKIYSHHDILKIIGSASNCLGLSSINTNNFRVKITNLSAFNQKTRVYVNGVFVKTHIPFTGAFIEINKQVNSQTDDARCNKINGNTYSDGAFTHYIGKYTDGNSYLSGFRFTNINIPKNNIIVEASIDFYNVNDQGFYSGNSFQCILKGEAADSSVTFSPNSSPFSRVKTIKDTLKSFTPTNSASMPGFGILKTNITPIVQEIINRTGWKTNNALSIFIEQYDTLNSFVSISSYDRDSTRGAKLYVKYLNPISDKDICEYFPEAEKPNTTTWAGNLVKKNDVIIEANKVLTITGIVQFTEQARLIVNPGGKLIINGGTLTNYCNNSFWQGVIIKGDKTKSQSDETNHGIVEIKNNGTIANALVGITTQDINNTATVIFGGGIIRAENAKFTNNKLAVKMNAYQNFDANNILVKFNDYSYFRKTEFILNTLPMPNQNFEGFVNLNAINGLNFTACKFQNLDTIQNLNKGTGIRSTESKFSVNSACSSQFLFYAYQCPPNKIIPSEFRNLEYGIYAFTNNPLKNISVRNAIFDNNKRGVFSKNHNYSWFTSNTFKVPDYYEAGVDNTVNSAYGMYLDHCTGYTIEGNSFNKVDNAVNNAAYGLVINESGDTTANNTIYNNNFQNIEHSSTQIQGNNRGGGDQLKGLKIKCNDYTGNKQDITVIPLAAYDGISQYQGAYATSSQIDITKPAGNTFSKNGNTALTDFSNSGLNLNYYHHYGDTSNIWVPKYCNPAPKITLIQTWAFYIKELACPSIALQSGLPTPYPYNPIQINTFLNQKKILKNSSQLILNLWVDGGNTEGLREEVKLAYPWEAYVLFNDLLLHSPYLSDEVLIDAIKREDVLPPIMLKLILLANPQAVRSDGVWDALHNRVNPLSDDMIDEIKQGLEIISPKENLEADVSFYANECNTYSNLLKQYYLADTIGDGMQNLIQILSNETDIASRYEMVFAKLNNNDFEGALTALASVEGMFDAENNPYEMDRFNKMNRIIPILISIETENTTWNTISETDKNYLIEISETDRNICGSIATTARILFDNTFEYNEPIYLPNERPLKMANFKKANKSIANETILKISPNPAKDYIIAEFTIDQTACEVILQINDMQGRILIQQQLHNADRQAILDIRNLKNGTYYCALIINGQVKKSTKIVVKH